MSISFEEKNSKGETQLGKTEPLGGGLGSEWMDILARATEGGRTRSPD